MADYPYVHLVRGSLLAELGQNDAARCAFGQAMSHARNSAERRQIAARLALLGATRQEGI